MLCKNMGSSGGVVGGRGAVRINTASRLLCSISEGTLATTTSSDQRTCRNLEGDTTFKQRSTSIEGSLLVRAIFNAVCMACRGYSCHDTRGPIVIALRIRAGK